MVLTIDYKCISVYICRIVFKTDAETQNCPVDAETRKLLHSPRMHMPKHEAATWFEKADAETRSCHSVQICRC